MFFQNAILILVLVFTLLYLLRRFFGLQLREKIARILLKRGQVKWAMRIRGKGKARKKAVAEDCCD